MAPGVVLMPSYVNVGAWVGSGTMVDTWATVGSCAQIGTDVHLSGGVGIGGVLEPLQASPVIVEDGAFVGSRCIVVEGVRVGREAVLGANVVLTASTPIIDVRGKEPVELRGEVPPRAIVIPGTRKKKFPAGSYRIPCALIIGERSASTDRKTSLTEALREHAVSVSRRSAVRGGLNSIIEGRGGLARLGAGADPPSRTAWTSPGNRILSRTVRTRPGAQASPRPR